MFILQMPISGASQTSASSGSGRPANSPQIVQAAVQLQRQLLSAIASGNTEQQQVIQAQLDRLTTLNGGPIQLPQAVRTQYNYLLQQLTERAAPLRMQLLQATVKGDDRLAQNIQNRLSNLDAIYNQTQQFLGIQNPTGVPLTNTERMKFQYGTQLVTQQILSLEQQLSQAVARGDNSSIQEISPRITNSKFLLSVMQGFLGTNNR